MATKKDKPVPPTAWKPGVSANPNGRPKGTSRPISRLRGTLNKLKALEPDAIDVIGKVLNPEQDDEGKEIPVDAKKVDIAKWIIQQINSLTRGAIAEEAYKISTAPQPEPEEQKKNGTTDTAEKPVRFSLSMIEDD